MRCEGADLGCPSLHRAGHLRRLPHDGGPLSPALSIPVSVATAMLASALIRVRVPARTRHALPVTGRCGGAALGFANRTHFVRGPLVRLVRVDLGPVPIVDGTRAAVVGTDVAPPV